MDLLPEITTRVCGPAIPSVKWKKSKKDISLDIQDNILAVHAERHSGTEEKDEKDKVIRMERSDGPYTRNFDIFGVDTNNSSAKYENGVLRLPLPKVEPKLPEGRCLAIE